MNYELLLKKSLLSNSCRYDIGHEILKTVSLNKDVLDHKIGYELGLGDCTHI